MNEIHSKLDEANRTLNDFDASKKKLAVENTDLLRQLEEAESQIGQLSKIKLSLTNQLEDTRKLADDECRERATLLGKFRNLEHDIDGLREQLDEESEGKADLQRQLSKANAEAQMWRAKYESEGVARVEELEAARMKLAARLEEAEGQIEQLNVKNMNLEKTKQRISTELEDMQIQCERAQALADAAEKKQKNFDRIISEWKMKVDDPSMRSRRMQDALRLRRRNFRLPLRKLKLPWNRRRTTRCVSLSSQVRQEIDRRIQEKEEEFENTRKCHQRAIDSMQASLEAEAKGKAEALRMKKKLESDINELEIALDHSNKANADLQKQIKKIQGRYERCPDSS
ncbi:myosin heavy chain, isoform N [Penaeus vannamei]|uniref:Myosin heavy chain, isoform N n=1 Tax=Penaeus vannamei TaxID=6689 RepID=A0A423TZS3_PENVA|nr:myosin heavy chain, isoform N [Penaeus vannamei]